MLMGMLTSQDVLAHCLPNRGKPIKTNWVTCTR
jgi:hypothetical protein